LFNIKLPKVLTAISYGAFKNCINIKTMELPTSVTEIGHYAFRYCDKLKSISMPSVTTIGQQAFYHCFSLTKLIFGSKISYIDAEAFSNCNRVSEITSYSLNPALLGTNAFNGINPQSCKLRILKEADFDAYFNAPQWGSFLNVERITGLSENTVNESISNNVIQLTKQSIIINCKQTAIIQIFDIKGNF
ncbi:leucine-rich repeat domain-containing protein, partial [bacterium]|nr:leucine-rich repeat domain-containing protein [bacterium]